MNRTVHFKAIFVGGACMLLSILAVPHTTYAITYQEQVAIDAKIEQLLQQISYLQDLLAARQAQTTEETTAAGPYEIYKTYYFPNTYESIYEVAYDLDLVRRDSDTQTRSIDQTLWDMFIDTVGDTAVSEYHVSEFRVYDEDDSAIAAFVERKRGTHNWILGINRAEYNRNDRASKELYTLLLIHEYAHLISFDEDIADDFADDFWNSTDYAHAHSLENLSEHRLETALENYYDDNKGRFVSDYATYSPDEDLAETFVTFVTDNAPQGSGKNEKEEKILWMYGNSTLLDARSEIRENLDL